ncbi:helix-turn-helix domain-containing protein [Pseudonocardia sp. NPDC049635]|uniref:PucR family transcriptional regulator n=1 Tax=Pseudonocardia sp. NPDC049635 TaxID=3155506 RepID=UPI0033EB4985
MAGSLTHLTVGPVPAPVLVADPPAASDPLARRLAGLSAAVLAGAPPGQLVTRAAELLGLPVALRGTDPQQLRCWAAPAAFRLDRAPALPAAALAVPELRRGLTRLGPGLPSVVLPPAPVHGLPRRHLLAVLMVEGETGGYLDVAELGRSLGPADAPFAEQLAAVLSVQLTGEVVTARAAARNRDDALADLLHGTRAEPDLVRLAARVGLDPAVGHVLVRFPVRTGRSASACRDGVLDALTALPGAARGALAEPDAVVTLLELPPETAPGGLRGLHDALRSCLDRVAAVTGVRRAVVSGAIREVCGYPAALAETRDVDELAAALGGSADVVPVTELSTLRLVVNGDRTAVAVRFAEQCLGPLRRNDTGTGGDLVETLRCYLAAGAQVRAAATRLGVHENTVRYRLGRIEHLTGLDMRRFDALLAAQLALQVEVLAAGPDPSHEEGSP